VASTVPVRGQPGHRGRHARQQLGDRRLFDAQGQRECLRLRVRLGGEFLDRRRELLGRERVEADQDRLGGLDGQCGDLAFGNGDDHLEAAHVLEQHDGLACRDDLIGLHEPVGHDAVERSRKHGVRQRQPRRTQRSLGGFDLGLAHVHRGARPIEVGLRGVVVLVQTADALVLLGHLVQLGTLLGELGLQVHHLDLVVPRIEAGQQLAPGDPLALADREVHDGTAHAKGQGNALGGLHLAGEDTRHAFAGRTDGEQLCRTCELGAVFGRVVPASGAGQPGDQHQRAAGDHHRQESAAFHRFRPLRRMFMNVGTISSGRRSSP
jgi:hypothetical protein